MDGDLAGSVAQFDPLVEIMESHPKGRLTMATAVALAILFMKNNLRGTQ